MAELALDRLLVTLAEHGVEFIIVGGVAAVLQGVPVVTQDADVLYKLEESNILRLKRALDALNAVARGDPRKLRFDESHLRTTGHKLSTTDVGPLDVLGAINEDLRFEDLVDATDLLDIQGHSFRVLTLEKIIELKRRMNRPKDRAMLPLLEATLNERNRNH